MLQEKRRSCGFIPPVIFSSRHRHQTAALFLCSFLLSRTEKSSPDESLKIKTKQFCYYSSPVSGNNRSVVTRKENNKHPVPILRGVYYTSRKEVNWMQQSLLVLARIVAILIYRRYRTRKVIVVVNGEKRNASRLITICKIAKDLAMIITVITANS